MDSQVIIPMLKSPKVLHLEITDVCQAACPQCAREYDKNFNKKIQRWLTVDNIKNLVPTDTIKQLDKMFMCGNYGDPAAGSAIEIFNYFRQINPNITLGMNTNGGMQSTRWWQLLGTILNQERDYVVFSIDGLEDTNHLYRKNVIWKNVIKNATAFIEAGGRAHWEMIIFEHNEHQIDAVEKLARELGFYILRHKVSRRHSYIPIENLNPPKKYDNSTQFSNKINCHALEENSIYLSTRGEYHPCCWQGYIGGPTIDKFDDLINSWNSEPNSICKQTCGVSSNKTAFTNQWRKEIQLC
jgi:MoaA/NifB/PqqE/SkfB family radical SAM enzyme